MRGAVAGDRAAAPAGTGIGLSIVRRVVEACGGRVEVAASPAGGTRVSFDLPAALTVDAAAGEEKPTSGPRPVPTEA